jgi:hypothetical protein
MTHLETGTGIPEWNHMERQETFIEELNQIKETILSVDILTNEFRDEFLDPDITLMRLENIRTNLRSSNFSENQLLESVVISLDQFIHNMQINIHRFEERASFESSMQMLQNERVPLHHNGFLGRAVRESRAAARRVYEK